MDERRCALWINDHYGLKLSMGLTINDAYGLTTLNCINRGCCPMPADSGSSADQDVAVASLAFRPVINEKMRTPILPGWQPGAVLG